MSTKQTKTEIIRDAVERREELELPPTTNRKEFIEAMVAKGLLPKDQNIIAGCNILLRILRERGEAEAEASGYVKQENKRHHYITDEDVYIFYPPGRPPFSIEGDPVRQMKRSYSNPPEGLGYTINQVCQSFQIGRAEFVFIKSELGWTHDQDEFTREEHTTQTTEQLLEDREQRSRWKLAQAERERRMAELERLAAVGRDIEALREAYAAAPANVDYRTQRIFSADLERLVVLPLTDLHLGQDPDLDRQKIELCVRLVQRLPASGAAGCLIAVTGDLFHFDTFDRKTSRGTAQESTYATNHEAIAAGHAGLRTILAEVDKCFPSGKEIVFVRGNHDEMSMLHLEQCYPDAIVPGGAPLKAVKFGEALLLFGHGDQGRNKPENSIMYATQKFRADLGATRRTYLFGGHLHHEQTRDIVGVTVFQLPAVAASGAWSKQNCYASVPKLAAYLFDLGGRHLTTLYEEMQWE